MEISKELFRNLKKRADRTKIVLFSLFFALFANFSFSQDSIPEIQDLTEEAELKFQEFFFKALSQRSIGNHQKAIENLENCNQLLTNDIAVFFEFSKNYLALNNSLLAKEYIQRALAKDATNIWMLKHLVAIHQKEKNYAAAIKTQQKVVDQNPKERTFLVRLYMYNRQYTEAIALMDTLENENALSVNLKRLRASLQQRKIPEFKEKKLTDSTALINQFKTDKSYKILEQILKISENNPLDVLKYSEEGISLFPAQPYVYLMKAKALNDQKSYKSALTTLENGIDFVIEDKMEADFYNQMAKAHKGLGNAKEAQKYEQKAKKLKS
jgi:tetratricopeptide (TPR) repeat protein